MSVRGSLSTMSIEDIFLWLQRSQLRATLTVERAPVARIFIVDAGVINRATSNDSQDDIGELLLGAGLLDGASLDEARKVQVDTGVPLIRILTMVDKVDEARLRSVLEERALAAIGDVFTWEDGTFAVETGKASGEAVEIQIALPLERCIEAGRRHLQDFQSGGAEAEWASESLISAVVAEPSVDDDIEAARRMFADGRGLDALDIIEKVCENHPDSEAAGELRASIERALFAELSQRLLSEFRIPKLLVDRDDLASLPLSEHERYLATRVDNRWDLLSLLRVSPMREVEALITFQRLADRGIISL